MVERRSQHRRAGETNADKHRENNVRAKLNRRGYRLHRNKARVIGRTIFGEWHVFSKLGEAMYFRDLREVEMFLELLAFRELRRKWPASSESIHRDLCTP